MLIVAQMTGAVRGGGDQLEGEPHDFDRAHALDLAQLTEFVGGTRPNLVEPLDRDDDSVTRRAFLARLQGEIRRGIQSDIREKRLTPR